MGLCGTVFQPLLGDRSPRCLTSRPPVFTSRRLSYFSETAIDLTAGPLTSQLRIRQIAQRRFRHTFSVELLKAGVDIRKALGHSSVVITERYLREVE